jgi:hypothetical protein
VLRRHLWGFRPLKGRVKMETYELVTQKMCYGTNHPMLSKLSLQ